MEAREHEVARLEQLNVRFIELAKIFPPAI